jgi:predicted phage tail protein
MRDVYVYGRLAEVCGASKFSLEVETAGEAMRALAANFKAFPKVLAEASWTILRGDPDTGYSLDLEEIKDYRLGRAPLHIMPAVEGSKNSTGTLKIVAGLAIVGAAVFFAPGLALGTALGGGLLSGVTYGSIAMVGIAVALSGVSVLMGPAETEEDTKDDSSHTMAGPTSVYEQGNPVPLVYGETITGGVLVSVSLDIEDIGKFKSGAGNGSGN